MQAATVVTMGEGAFGLPLGGVTLAAVVMIAGVSLVAYGLRRVLSRRGDARAAPTVAEEMRELTDRLASDLDRRAERLERLIAVADARIAALEKPEGRPPAPASIVEAKGAEPAYLNVYELADAGLPAVEIARRTQRPTGQIELILNLRRGSVAL